MIDTQTTEEMITVYTGWDELEKPNKVDVIDFYLIPRRKGVKFTSREQVLERLKDLHSRIKPTNNEEEFIKAKLNTSIYFLRALMGEKIPFPEYVQNITGVKSQLIPEKVIQRHKELLEESMKAVGYRPKTETFDDFYKRIHITREEAIEEVNLYQKALIPKVKQILGFNNLRLKYDFEQVEEDDYWGFWTSTRPDGSFLLRGNFHPVIKWRNGDIERILIHEIDGHFIHGENLKTGIARGEINPFIGVTTTQDPHTFSGEGSANSIAYLPEVEKLLSEYALMSRQRVLTQGYIKNNAHIWVNEGKDIEDVLEYVLVNDLFADKERDIGDLERRKNNPARRAYQYVYGISDYIHRQLIDRLSPEKQKEFLRYEMKRYEMPERLIEFANRLFLE